MSSPIPPIDRQLILPVEPAVAWRAVTDPERVIDWFTNASPVGPVGSVYRLDFGDGSVVAGEVTELDPGRRFAHRWHWEGADDAQTTLRRHYPIPAPRLGQSVGSPADTCHT